MQKLLIGTMVVMGLVEVLQAQDIETRVVSQGAKVAPQATAKQPSSPEVSTNQVEALPKTEVEDEEGPVVWFEEHQIWGRLRKRVDSQVWVVAEVAKPGKTFTFVKTVQKRGLLGVVKTTTTVTTVTTDPYGFTNWLNSTRAQYGLAPVGYDPNLTNWGHQNNLAQSSRGLGHHVMGPSTRQNAAMSGSYASVPGMWLSSPGHRAALLDPSIRWIGIAGLGTWWTFNAR